MGELNNKARYKYFNLIVRSIIGIAAIFFIYYKLKDNYQIQFTVLDFKTVSFLGLISAFLLSFFNWGIESAKWRQLIYNISPISFLKAYKIVLTGITLSLITPNRVGEIPARAYLLNDKETLKKTIYATFIGSFSQLLITVLFGVSGLFFTLNWFDIYLPKSVLMLVVGFVIALFFAFFFSNKIKALILKLVKRESSIEFSQAEYLKTLSFSLFRYGVFILQYYLLLEAFGIHFNSCTSIWLIPVCFFIASSIPTFLISELGVRSSVAIVVFGVLSQNDVAIISASILLWVINIGIPAIVGILFLKQLNVSN